MVSADMFKDAFVVPERTKKTIQPTPTQPVQQMPEDPEIAKLRFLMLKWLSIIIGGSAALLIVWRVILKFF